MRLAETPDERGQQIVADGGAGGDVVDAIHAARVRIRRLAGLVQQAIGVGQQAPAHIVELQTTPLAIEEDDAQLLEVGERLAGADSCTKSPR